jgi:hypothetical protein
VPGKKKKKTFFVSCDQRIVVPEIMNWARPINGLSALSSGQKLYSKPLVNTVAFKPKIIIQIKYILKKIILIYF